MDVVWLKRLQLILWTNCELRCDEYYRWGLMMLQPFKDWWFSLALPQKRIRKILQQLDTTGPVWLILNADSCLFLCSKRRQRLYPSHVSELCYIWNYSTHKRPDCVAAADMTYANIQLCFAGGVIDQPWHVTRTWSIGPELRLRLESGTVSVSSGRGWAETWNRLWMLVWNWRSD